MVLEQARPFEERLSEWGLVSLSKLWQRGLGSMELLLVMS